MHDIILSEHVSFPAFMANKKEEFVILDGCYYRYPNTSGVRYQLKLFEDKFVFQAKGVFISALLPTSFDVSDITMTATTDGCGVGIDDQMQIQSFVIKQSLY